MKREAAQSSAERSRHAFLRKHSSDFLCGDQFSSKSWPEFALEASTRGITDMALRSWMIDIVVKSYKSTAASIRSMVAGAAASPVGRDLDDKISRDVLRGMVRLYLDEHAFLGKLVRDGDIDRIWAGTSVEWLTGGSTSRI